MNAKPILFSAPMIRALLAGQKSQTRRIVKPQPEPGADSPYHVGAGDKLKARVCPFGKLGDLLWVRECTAFWWDTATRKRSHVMGYRADINDPDWDGFGCDDPWWLDAKWEPSIHMPRWASRLTLRITGSMIEPVQDIGERDAQLEGTEFACENGLEDCHRRGYEAMYAELWDDLHGVGSWRSNPFVWVIYFEVIQKNIDEYLAS